MDLNFLLKGLLFGFSIAAPVGPIGVLCIRRTLADGRSAGLLSGLGAASADAIYGSIAAFGVAFISDFLVSQQFWIRLVGGLFLCYLGIKTMLARPAESPASSNRKGLLGAYASTLFLTLTNPMTILSFAAIFSGLGLAGDGGNYASAGLMVLGVFCGSCAWWLLLSSLVSIFRGRFTFTGLKWINRVSGMVIFGFGVYSLFSILKNFTLAA